MKQSAENWIAQVKLQRQARRLARCAVASLVADGGRARGEIRIARASWLSKLWDALLKGFSNR